VATIAQNVAASKPYMLPLLLYNGPKHPFFFFWFPYIVCLLAFVAHFPLHVTLVLVGASLHGTITLLPFAAATFLGVAITASFHPAVTFLPFAAATFLGVVIMYCFLSSCCYFPSMNCCYFPSCCYYCFFLHCCIVQRANWAKKSRGSTFDTGYI
jgi:hypothetical protein